MTVRLACLGVCLVISACAGQPADDPEVQHDESVATEQSEVAPRSTGPTSLAEIAPGDTGAILGLMRQVMTAGDSAARGAEVRDTVLPPLPDQQPRRLQLYLIGDDLLKLVATEPNDAGQMTGETSAWFANGEVRVVQEPFAAYFLDADRLVLWTDGTLQPVAIPEADRMAREQVVLDTLAARLAVFGVRYP